MSLFFFSFEVRLFFSFSNNYSNSLYSLISEENLIIFELKFKNPCFSNFVKKMCAISLVINSLFLIFYSKTVKILIILS